MQWKEKYEVTLSLIECYTKTGKCVEALELCKALLVEVKTNKEKPRVELGKAASYVCKGSYNTAVKRYEFIVKTFPKSDYSAEAYYRLGVIYHENLDSLRLAQEAYSKVSNESASSEFASISLQRSNSLKRLLELQEKGSGDEGAIAEKRFLAAEIQFTRLGEIQQALENYSAVVDSFPGTVYAPMAAYAIGWIYRVEIGDTLKAVSAFSRLVRDYPVSPQASGAIDELGLLGEKQLKDQLAAYVDSALADSARIAAEEERVRMEAAAAAEASIDSIGEQETSPDSSGAAPSAITDSLGVVPPTPADSLGVVPPTPADSLRAAAKAVSDSSAVASPALPDSSAGARPAGPDSSASGGKTGRGDDG
jgi:TolA-binding protein